MKIDNLRVEKITDLPYRDKLPQIDNDAIYCEIQYKRDRSSFAGMAFKFIDKENVLKSNFVEEKVIQIVSKYENLCVGSDLQYLECIERFFLSKKGIWNRNSIFAIFGCAF